MDEVPRTCPCSNSNNRPYDILIVEDNDNDAELFLNTLRKVQMEMDVELKPHIGPDQRPGGNSAERAEV
jgi:hypothetical protein